MLNEYLIDVSHAGAANPGSIDSAIRRLSKHLGSRLVIAATAYALSTSMIHPYTQRVSAELEYRNHIGDSREIFVDWYERSMQSISQYPTMNDKEQKSVLLELYAGLGTSQDFITDLRSQNLPGLDDLQKKHDDVREGYNFLLRQMMNRYTVRERKDLSV